MPETCGSFAAHPRISKIWGVAQNSVVDMAIRQRKWRAGHRNMASGNYIVDAENMAK